MSWISITDKNTINKIKEAGDYSIIYKHSPRCSTSLMAYRRLRMEVGSFAPKVPLYIVDVISNRPESQAIENSFGITHESPQILLIKDGECIYNASHEDVSLEEPLSMVVS